MERGDIGDPIETAFGSHPESLGITVVKDLPPSYPALRGKLLRLANTFAGLDDATREKYAHAASKYRYGCIPVMVHNPGMLLSNMRV